MPQGQPGLVPWQARGREYQDSGKGDPEETKAPESDHAKRIVLLPFHQADDQLGKPAIEDCHRNDGAGQPGYSGIVEAQQDRGHPECTESEWCRVCGIVYQEQVVPALFFKRLHNNPHSIRENGAGKDGGLKKSAGIAPWIKRCGAGY